MPRKNAYPLEPDARPIYELPDPFGDALADMFRDGPDIASEAVWQELPKKIAIHWRSFTRDQSPLSTLGMIARCAETVLKIRLANRKGGGEEEAKRLQEFQALMAEIFREEPADALGLERTRETEPVAAWDEEEDEDG